MRINELSFTLICALALSGCGSSSSTSSSGSTTGSSGSTSTASVDIKDAVFTDTSGDCANYDNTLSASVLDIQRSMGFDELVTITSTADACTLSSNSIPNHDFDDATASFATPVSEISRSFHIPRHPSLAAQPTALSQQTYNAVMLNGVVLDELSAGCYDPSSPLAGPDGNTAIGCNSSHKWLLDPMGPGSHFGVDAHNAHTQPGGAYHYHGNPNAMFDDNPGPNGSPVIGFAADGFPIYGSYFLDPNTGTVRKAKSGYTLKAGTRPSSSTDPGGTYDGTYIDDWEFTHAGDLDACNGMTVNGQYGYYVTDSYPWVMGCISGTPDSSFNK